MSYKSLFFLIIVLTLPDVYSSWEQFQSDDFNTGRANETGYFDNRTIIKLINDVVAVDKFNQLKGFKQIGFAVNYDNIVESFDKKSLSLSGKKLKDTFKSQNIEVESIYKEIDTSFFNVDERPVKQTYILKNLLNTNKNVKLNIIYEIESNFVVWNNTKYAINNEPIYFKAFEVTEEIFFGLNETFLTGYMLSFGNNYYDFKDITDLNYSISVYSLNNKNYINLEINQDIGGLSEFVVEPVIGWTNYTIDDSAWCATSVFAIDVDNDNDIDAIGGMRCGSDNVVWYENGGNSPPNWTRHTIPSTGDAWPVYAIDIDSDNDIDVLSGSILSANSVSWYENDGNSPPGWTNHDIAYSDSAVSVYAIDVDNDNDTDVLSALLYSNKIAWYENNGSSPPSWTTHVITTDAICARSVFAIDIDKDNDVDVLSASECDNRINWYENNGSSPPGWTTHNITTNAIYAKSVFAIDVDNDNDTDVLSAANNTIAWYENDGNSPLGWTTHNIYTSVEDTWSVFAIDIDNDNDIDVLSASRGDEKVAWYENDGNSPPGWATHNITTNANDVMSVFAIDIDKDNDVDVLSASYIGSTINWYESKLTTLNICNGRVQIQSLDSNDNPVSFTNVFVDDVYKGTTDEFGLFELQQSSICGETISYTLKCSDNTQICETKTTTLDFHNDFDSLSFDCSVCTGDIDLRLDMRNIKANKEDNKMAVNISMINVPATNDVNITFKVQGNDGLISREESQLFNITSNDRFKFITQSIALSGNDFVHVYVDPNNEVTETNEKNNYALVPLFEKQINAYLNISTGYENIDNKIKDYLKLFVNEKSQDDADVTIAVGLPNKNTIINNKNSLTKENYKWFIDNIIYYNNKPLGSKPYNGLVGAFSDNSSYIFVAGNDIDGLIAAVKRLISARDLFFSNLNKDKVSVIEDTDVAGISVADLLRNPSNFPYYEKRGTIMFANVVERVLNDNNFEIDIKTVKTYNDNTTLRLKNINTDFSDNFKDAIIGNSKPVVLSRGIHSNLLSWEDFAQDLAKDPENARDSWLIEMVGGPTIDEDCSKYNCPDYTFSDLKTYYWPALIAGVEQYSEQSTIDYVGFSLGCSAALESLELYGSTGKNNAGYYFDSDTGAYKLTDLAINPVDTFVAVACPGNFTRLSTLMQAFNETFGYVNWSTRFIYGNHIKGGHINTEIIDTLRIINPDLANDLPPIVKFGLGKEGGSRMSMNIYEAFYEWINDPNQPKLGYEVNINNFLVIQGKSRNSYLENSLPHTWNNLESDTIVSTFDESEICTNIDSDNKYYASFEGIVHGGLISAIPEDPNVQSAIKEFLTIKKLSAKFEPKINNCEII